MIIVEYDSDVLGKGEFWRGPEDKIHEIHNIPARHLAEKVVHYGGSFADGMWLVRQENDEQ